MAIYSVNNRAGLDAAITTAAGTTVDDTIAISPGITLTSDLSVTGSPTSGSLTIQGNLSGGSAVSASGFTGGTVLTFAGALTQTGGFTVSDASRVTVAQGGSFYGVKLNGGAFTNLGSADTRTVANGPSNNTDAIQTNGGGTVTNGAANATGATIQAGGSGLGAIGSGTTIVNNYGLITGRDFAGVGQIGGDGAIMINNLNGATAGTGGFIYGQGLQGAAWGAFNQSGGGLTVTNESAAKIVGREYGVYGTGAATSVTNAGTIASGSYDAATGAITVGGTAGVQLRAGGTVSNTGTISGNFAGIQADGTATVTNSGAISAVTGQ